MKIIIVGEISPQGPNWRNWCSNALQFCPEVHHRRHVLNEHCSFHIEPLLFAFHGNCLVFLQFCYQWDCQRMLATHNEFWTCARRKIKGFYIPHICKFLHWIHYCIYLIYCFFTFEWRLGSTLLSDMILFRCKNLQ